MTQPDRFEKVTSLIKEKAKEILPAGSTVRLFGSRARGDAREDIYWEDCFQCVRAEIMKILLNGPGKKWNL